jgi:hypothetical protein
MSKKHERFPFVQRNAEAGPASLAPMVPLRLRFGRSEETIFGLIDTGAAVNVLPWSVGERLGADWDSATPVTLSGNLAAVESRVLVCEGLVGGFSPRRLAFAWSRSDLVPVLLGQVNFLLLFDVCLSRSGQWFEVAEPE